MNLDLVEIQPQELKFIFELKKQSSCSVRLINKSNHHVAFKVKTTSPKKYCVRPNTGVIKPRSACDFTGTNAAKLFKIQTELRGLLNTELMQPIDTRSFRVTMQAQKVAPPDLICKDKFLVQCTNVPAGTEDEDISTITFAKEDGKRVQEKKLRVILVSPPNSPVLSPINGTLKRVQAYEATELKDELKDQVANEDQNLSPQPKAIQHVEESKLEISENQEPRRDAEREIVKDNEELKFANDVDEMKSKLKELESKLHEAEETISKLTYEKGLTTQEKEKLRQELELVRSKKGVTRRVQVGFPLLYVCMVALISLFLGYQLHH